jgi:hypothetical protein
MRSGVQLTRTGGVVRGQVLQRFALGIHNLKTKSTIDFAAGGGKGNVVGSKIPHMTHAFQVGPTAAAPGATVNVNYRPDDWVNRDAGVTGAIKADISALSDFAFTQRLIQVFTNWDCTTTLFDGLLTEFVFSAAPAAKWFDPDNDDAFASVNVHDALHGRQNLAIHLVTMRAAIYWREKTMNTLNVNSVDLEGAHGATQTVALNWEAAKKAARKIIRKKLLDRIAPPLTPPSEGGAADQFGAAIFPALAALPSFQRIIVVRNYGGGRSYEIIGSDHFVVPGKRADVVGAYNHLRFALWTEWRAAYELYNF